MTQTVCFIRSDLSHLRRFGPGGASSWTANPIPESDRAELKPLLERVRAAAVWGASSPGRRRIDRVVVDVDESVCTMVRTPSTARPVLAASVRSGSQDWGELAPVSGLEPLIDPPAKPQRARKKSGSESASQAAAPASEGDGVSVAVISQTDALTRLWLDAMDGRGVRAGDVCSLWHAAAQAWGAAAADDVSLILLCEPERIVWAMARGSDLLCGGSAAVPTVLAPVAPEGAGPDAVGPGASGPAASGPASAEADPIAVAVRRCGLDWLSWSGQLGLAADRVLIVGPRASAVAELLPPAWCRGRAGASGGSVSSVEVHVDADPVGLTCTRLSQRAPDSGRPLARRSLVRLAARPTRSTRWRYGWAAAALVILGLGLGGLGYRLARAGNQVREASQQLRGTILTRAQTIVPNLAPNANVVWELESVVAKLRQAPAFAAPAPPPKIFDELLRVSETLAKFPGSRLKTVYLAGDAGRITCSVPDRPSSELLVAALGRDGAMKWNQPRDGSTDFMNVNLNGEWN